MKTYRNNWIYLITYFLCKRSKILIIGTVLCIILLVYWRYWNNHNIDVVHNASLRYENIIKTIRTDHLQTLNTVEQFIVDNKNIYGTLAALAIAQQYINKNELRKAAAQLKQRLAIVNDNNLKTIIELRLARVQIQQGNIDEALKILNSIKEDSFFSIIADIRGDALLSKNDKQGARNSWEAGMRRRDLPALKEIIQMKINNLSL